VAAGPELHHLRDVLIGRKHRYHDDFQVGKLPQEQPGHFVAAELGHLQIEQQHIGQPLPAHGHQLGQLGGFGYGFHVGDALQQPHQSQVIAEAAGLLEDVDKQDGLLAYAAPNLGVEILYRVEAQAKAVFGALGQGVAVAGQVLGLAALVQGFESGASHRLYPKLRRSIKTVLVTFAAMNALRFPHPLVLLTYFIMLAAVLSVVLPAGEFTRRPDPATGREVVVPGTYHRLA
nr:hypothetical protein [Tanacetum cinerariifolium]